MLLVFLPLFDGSTIPLSQDPPTIQQDCNSFRCIPLLTNYQPGRMVLSPFLAFVRWDTKRASKTPGKAPQSLF